MRALLKRSGRYVRNRDTLSWALGTAGVVEIAVLAESSRLHNEVSPYGGHHGDVAGGFLLFGFALFIALIILAFAGVVSLLGKMTRPINGAMLGLVASFPLGLVIGVLDTLLFYISPFFAMAFPFAAGIALVFMGFIRKPWVCQSQMPNQSPDPTLASGAPAAGQQSRRP